MNDATKGTPFFGQLARRFPSAASQIDDCELGLLHCEMGAFSRATEAALERNDFDTVEQHVHFIEELLKDANSELVNAISVSYLEHVFLYPNHPTQSERARAFLGPRGAKELEVLRLHFEKLEKYAKEKNK